MGNKTGVNPWSLDTAGTVTISPVRISRLAYYPSAADQDCVVTDLDGNVIWAIRAKASASNNESYSIEGITFNSPVGMRGFVLQTIDGGTLYVYLHSV